MCTDQVACSNVVWHLHHAALHLMLDFDAGLILMLAWHAAQLAPAGAVCHIHRSRSHKQEEETEWSTSCCKLAWWRERHNRGRGLAPPWDHADKQKTKRETGLEVLLPVESCTWEEEVKGQRVQTSCFSMASCSSALTAAFFVFS